MKASMKYLLLALMAGFALSACDIIKGDKIDPNGFSGSANKVLIEDFTGHRCGNCPRAHEKAAELQGTYGENLVVVAVHTGSFALVIPQLGYTTDFNTPMGTELGEYYNADQEGLPIGLINRRDWNGSPVTRFADWSTFVSAVLSEQPKIKLEITPTYDATDRSLDVASHLEYFTTGDASHNIVVLVTEDSIISKQEDYTFGEHEDYVHNHVLRTVLTSGTWGTPVKGNQIFLGEKLDLNFSTVLDSTIVPEHCHVVVYVHNNVTKEVIQVEEVDLME
jgi:hypothetical protein